MPFDLHIIPFFHVAFMDFSRHKHACMLVNISKHIYRVIITAPSLKCVYMMTNRVEEAGSVACLCMRCVRRRKCSLMESCTSVGMSGDVRLIFTAASRKPVEPMGSFTFSVAMVTGGCWGLGRQRGGWSGQSSRSQAGARDGPGKWALVRQGTRHSFQEMNVRRPSRARPQITNTQRKRPNEAPAGEPREPRTEHHTIWTNRWWLQGEERREREKRSIISLTKKTQILRHMNHVLTTVRQVLWVMCFINI